MKCVQNHQAFYGYKQQKFFDVERASEFRFKQAALIIRSIIDLVRLKDSLNLLGSLIHKHMEPRDINDLLDTFEFIPVNWEEDPAIFTDQLLPPKPKKKREETV